MGFWFSTLAVTGPFLTDLRLVKTAWLCEPTQPYMEALRKGGFSVVFRPNKVVGGESACADVTRTLVSTAFRQDKLESCLH